MEGNMERFQAKMKDLLAYAAKKKNVLEFQEVADFLQIHTHRVLQTHTFRHGKVQILQFLCFRIVL